MKTIAMTPQLHVTRRDAVWLSLASAGLLQGQTVVGPRTEPILIQCAGLEFLFDPKIAFVRHIRWNGIEVLNGIYVAVRDEVWGTVPPQVSNVIVETEADSFKVVFEVSCQQGGIDFEWRGTITGAPRALTFEMEGEAKTTFKKNRIGFCVLHPLKECVGKPCKIDREGNVTVDGKFPDAIAPHQPFVDMRGIRHEVYPGLMAEVRFTGDTFEMEDHRNWTDGNFKTYCTPLSKPFPVEVKQGAKIVQTVSLRLAGTPKPVPELWRKPHEVRIDAPAANAMSFARMPAIGFGAAMDQDPLTAADAKRLAVLAPAHIRVDLLPGAVDATLDRVANAISGTSASLEAAVFLSGDAGAAEAECSAVAAAVAKRKWKVARWMVFVASEPVTNRKWVDLARRHLKGAPVGAGTNQYFTELNRERPDMSALDFAAYSVNPQVHAFDNMSVMENLSPQADTVRTARTFVGSDKALAVSPVTLKPRFNPQAKVQPVPKPGELPARVDPRQKTLFAAAWTLGSLRYLAGGVNSVTYYETHGWAGVLDKDAAYPAYHVFASVAGWNEVAGPLANSDPSAVAAMLVLRQQRRQRRLLLANLTDAVQRVRLGLGGLNAAGWRVRILDSETEGEAMKRPEAFLAGYDWDIRGPGSRKEISLLPYATAILTEITT
jgi:hypothetical protein